MLDAGDTTVSKIQPWSCNDGAYSTVVEADNNHTSEEQITIVISATKGNHRTLRLTEASLRKWHLKERWSKESNWSRKNMHKCTLTKGFMAVLRNWKRMGAEGQRALGKRKQGQRSREKPDLVGSCGSF